MTRITEWSQFKAGRYYLSSGEVIVYIIKPLEPDNGIINGGFWAHCWGVREEWKSKQNYCFDGDQSWLDQVTIYEICPTKAQLLITAWTGDVVFKPKV